MDVTRILNDHNNMSPLTKKQVGYVGVDNAFFLYPEENERIMDIVSYLKANDGVITWDESHPLSFLAEYVHNGKHHAGAPSKLQINKSEGAFVPLVCKNVLGKNIQIHTIKSKGKGNIFIPVYDETEKHIFYISDTGESRRLDKEHAAKNGFEIVGESLEGIKEMKNSPPNQPNESTIKRISAFIIGSVAPSIRINKGREALARTLAKVPQIPTPKVQKNVPKI